MASILSAKHFHDERAAYAFVEARVWANGRVCPHCGVVDNSTPLMGKSTRHGVYKCKEKACRKPFTVKVGTVFEASNVKLHIWLQAMHLLCSSKKGISSNQLHRTLGVTLKTAWFMSHRIREAMRGGELAPFGAGGTHVEVDETFLLKDPDAKPGKTRNPNWHEKMKVLTLVDRASGRARSFVVDSLKAADLAPILSANIAKEARLLTDEAPRYIGLGRMFADHQTVNHGKEEYVRRTDRVVHTNTVENYYSVFKRGMRGTYQHCAKRHLHRYMAEFDFRYSNRVALGVDDAERAEIALKGVVGRRLTYKPANATL
jgi:transposase-like protein